MIAAGRIKANSEVEIEGGPIHRMAGPDGGL